MKLGFDPWLHTGKGAARLEKACARAVGRNRIKRVIRESFRAQMAGSELNKTLDFVVLSTVATEKQSNKTLDESLAAHWQRLIRKAEYQNSGDRQDQQRTQR